MGYWIHWVAKKALGLFRGAMKSESFHQYEKIKAAENLIESRKQEFMSSAHELIDAESKKVPPEERERLVQLTHQSAVRFFSSVEDWVKHSSYLRAHEDPLWRYSLAGRCRAALNSYLKYWDFLGRESTNLGIDLQDRFRPNDDTYCMMQGMVKLEYPDSWTPLRQQFHDRRLPTNGFDNKSLLIRLQKGQIGRNEMTTERWIAVVFAFVFITVLLALVVIIGETTPLMEKTFTTVLALSAGAIGAVIPGVLKLEGRLGGFAVRATGALALFFIVYFWNPASSSDNTPIDTPQTESDAQ